MKVILSVFILLTLAAFVGAQDTSSISPIVNEDIIRMSRTGVGPAVVVAKIKTSRCKFDTSPSALVVLKDAGVADEVLIEMVRNPNGAPPPVTAPPPNAATVEAKEEPATSSQPAGDSLPEYGDISEIRRMRRVYVIADDIDSQNLLVRSLTSYDGLDVVSSPDRAEVFVAFGQGASATGMQLSGLFRGTIDYRTKAQFIVFYRNERGRHRIVWQETEDIQTSSGFTFSRPNEVNVVRHFIKALKKIRSE